MTNSKETLAHALREVSNLTFIHLLIHAEQA